MSNIVSFEPDEWIQDRWESETLWIAYLSDGTKVFMDDERPEMPHHSAWVRLKNYCEINNLYVVKIQLKFRSHSEFVFDEHADGYAFRRGCLGSFGNPTRHFFHVGILKGNTVRMYKYSTPELILEDEEDRDPSSLEDCLILRTKFE